MILTFKDKGTEDIFNVRNSKEIAAGNMYPHQRSVSHLIEVV
jgi:hypothetical protein